MALTSRKRRPLNRTITHLRDTKLFIIATEGEKTEKQYFEMFRNPRAQVKVIPTQEGKSAPEYVLERLKEFHREYQLTKTDELWLMIDVDRWQEVKLSQIAAIAIQKGYYLAVSNPCFELWLCLHLSEANQLGLTCRDLEAFLRNHSGSYNKANLRPEVYLLGVNDALRRAKELHSNDQERWPTQTGSHVYKIVEKLL